VRVGRSKTTPGRRRPGGGSASPAERPLRLLSRAVLESRFASALAAADGLDGAHCVHEWWMRGEPAANVEVTLARLWSVAATTVPEWLPMRHVDWLPLAYEVGARFQRTGRGRQNLYLVLLDYADSARGPHGVYVGSSRYAPAERFDQHKAGLRAAGSVLKRGLEVLTGPVLHLQGLPRTQAAEVEEGLAEALRAEGLIVHGGH
jgi:hypothetical protein